MKIDFQGIWNTISVSIILANAFKLYPKKGPTMSESGKMKETKELIDLILGAVAVSVDAQKDGKLSFEDAALLVKLIPDFVPAFEGMGQVPSELASMSEADAAELSTHVMVKLAIEDGKARKVVDAALKFAVAGYGLVSAIKA